MKQPKPRWDLIRQVRKNILDGDYEDPGILSETADMILRDIKQTKDTCEQSRPTNTIEDPKPRDPYGEKIPPWNRQT